MASKKGPGSASKAGRSQGRVTTPSKHQGSSTGRYISAEASGRYTAPTPKSVYHSPRWYGPAILVMLILGLLTIALNYLGALPGAVSSWYLLVGIVVIFVGFFMLIRYR